MDEPKNAPTPEEDKKEETPDEEVKSVDEVTEAKVEPEKEETEKEETLGDILETEEKPEEKPESRTVPEAALLEYKNANKELKRDIKELKELVESGASKGEVSKSLEDLATEHDISPDLLNSLAKTIRTEVSAEMESKFSPRVKSIEDKERNERIGKVFETHYTRILEARPEFKDVAQKEVIKALSLNPANSKKTISNLLDEAYGHLLSGKRTLETSRARGGEGVITDIDYARAGKDTEYFNQIMEDPQLKKKYNDNLGKRLNF